MKYWPLIWSGIWRKPGRTLLMLLQILVAFLLFGALQGVKSGVDQAVAATQAQLYWVFPADLGTKLPLGLEQRIAAVPGVKHIYPEAGFGATYQRPHSRWAFLLPISMPAGPVIGRACQPGGNRCPGAHPYRCPRQHAGPGYLPLEGG